MKDFARATMGLTRLQPCRKFGIAILLTLVAKKMPRGICTTPIQAEVASDVGIFVCYAFAYGITDGIIPR
jgi:hypothetical protein